MADTEQFDDFKDPSYANVVDPTIDKIINKELSDVEQFKVGFDETLEMSSDPKYELMNTIIGYIQGIGDVDQVEICEFDNGNGIALDGWAFNCDEDLTSIDLFLAIYVPPEKSDHISVADLDRHLKKLVRFFDQSQNGKMLGKIEDTKSDLFRVADIIHSEEIERVRFFLMTNAIASSEYKKNDEEINDGIDREYVIWDAKRVKRQDDIIAGKSKINVNFQADYEKPLPCIQMPKVSENVDCFLCIIPGWTLAKIYREHHQQLLEQNVRTFLQFKGASNKGIRDTMVGHKVSKKESLNGDIDTPAEPDMFFAYNNGISTTAEDIELSEDGKYITKIKDWQIVNGGQTTASISAVFSSKDINVEQLMKVFVPMKVSVIRRTDRKDIIVKKISRYANTQSVVKKSDFNISEKFLVSLEQLSRQEWVKNLDGKPINKWFFERTRGQYLDKAFHNQAKSAEKEFFTEYPRNQMFDKALLSKFMMAWMLDPASVCKGGENNYDRFFKKMLDTPEKIDAESYHKTIAKAILFKAIDALYGRDGMNLPGYKSNMVAYTLAAISLLTKQKLNLQKIWEEQCVISMPVFNEMTMDIYSVYAKMLQGQHVAYKIKKKLKTDDGRIRNRYISKDFPQEDLLAIKNTVLYKTLEFVKEVKPDIWSHIVSVDAGKNINEWTKQHPCWEALKNTLENKNYKIPKEILCQEQIIDGGLSNVLNEAQQKIVSEAHRINANEWTDLHQWSKDVECLTPLEISFVGNFAFMVKKNKPFTYKQAKKALELREKAITAGWNP